MLNADVQLSWSGGVDADELGHALAWRPAVVSVRDLHVWEVTSAFPALIVVATNEDCDEAHARLEQLLRNRFATADPQTGR